MRQIAVLPYRAADEAPIEILLITSRETRRWIVPKGNPMKGLTPHDAAAVEAREEAGVLGEVAPVPLGAYRYRKRLASGRSVWAVVDIFPLGVTEELQTWDEQHERERRWFPFAEAADAVDEPDLAAIIRRFGAGE